MTDRLPRSELDLLRDEVEHLRAEVEGLRVGPEGLRVGPAPKINPAPEINRKVSWWVRVFGRKVYTGPKTCGHCVQFKPYFESSPGSLVGWTWSAARAQYYHWGCKLLVHGWKRQHDDQGCDRFKPRRRYMHRVRD